MTHLDLNFCFDTGHAHMGEGVEAEFDIMKPRIRSTHVHDNDGKDDQHLFPFIGRRRHHRLEEHHGTAARGPDQYPLLLELKEVPDMASIRWTARRKSSTGWKTS